MKLIKKVYINTLGYILSKLDRYFLYTENKLIDSFLREAGFYIFNYRVKHSIFD